MSTPTYENKRQIRERMRVKEELNNFLNRVLRRNKISTNGENYFRIGRTFNKLEDAEEYATNFITPLFAKITAELELLKAQYNALCKTALDSLKKESESISDSLSPDAKNGYLFDLAERMKYNIDKRNEFKKLATQEVALHDVIENTITASNKNLQEVINTSKDAAFLAGSLKQRQVFLLLKLTTSKLKNAIKKSRSYVHSRLHPPSWGVVITLLVIVFIFSIGEIGLSLRIMRQLVNNVLGNDFEKFRTIIDLTFATLFCVTITLSSAFSWEFIMERLMHQTWKRTLAITGIFFSAVIFLSFVYSTKYANKDVLKYFAHDGILIGFFSVMIAFSNAILLKKAAYLYHQILEINKMGGLKRLTKRRDRFCRQWNNKLQQVEKDQIFIQGEIDSFNDKFLTTKKTQLSNLERICIYKVKLGFKSKRKRPIPFDAAEKHDQGPSTRRKRKIRALKK